MKPIEIVSQDKVLELTNLSPCHFKNTELKEQSINRDVTEEWLNRKIEDMDLLNSDPKSVRANAYDMALNGTEIGGGSIRIFDKSLKERVKSIELESNIWYVSFPHKLLVIVILVLSLNSIS